MDHEHSTADLLQLLRRGCVAATGRDVGLLKPEQDLQALGIDSVALLELVGWAEAELGARVPDEELARLRTVGDLCRRLQAGAVAQ